MPIALAANRKAGTPTVTRPASVAAAAVRGSSISRCAEPTAAMQKTPAATDAHSNPDEGLGHRTEPEQPVTAAQTEVSARHAHDVRERTRDRSITTTV
ncbi:hypothetical protein GS884_07620 [Rhodococcus hoagii]|nr:hypothetical protein [Prescottella equi]